MDKQMKQFFPWRGRIWRKGWISNTVRSRDCLIVSIYICHLTIIEIPIIKVSQSYDGFLDNGNPIHGKMVFILKHGPMTGIPQLTYGGEIYGISCASGSASGPCLNIKTVFSRYGDSYVKIRWSWDHLIFNMGIPILVRRHLYIDMAPSHHSTHRYPFT